MLLKRSEDFNDWRRENDLPQFLAFANETLPHFGEWQEVFGVTDELFLQSNQTSEFFVDGGLHAFYRYYNPWHWDKTHEVRSASIESFEKTKECADLNNRKITGIDKFEYELHTEFVPFFDWLKTVKGIEISKSFLQVRSDMPQLFWKMLFIFLVLQGHLYREKLVLVV